MCCRWQAGTKHQKEAVSIAGGYCAHHGADCWSVSRSIPCVVYPAIVAAWSCKRCCLFMPGFSVPAPPTHPWVAQYTRKQATEKGSCILRLEQYFSTFCLYPHPRFSPLLLSAPLTKVASMTAPGPLSPSQFLWVIKPGPQGFLATESPLRLFWRRLLLSPAPR